jgi:hypothetical protein
VSRLPLLLLVLLFLLAALFFAACGGTSDTPAAPAAASAASLSVSVQPGPTSPSGSDPSALVMTWQVVIANGADRGRISFVNATVRDATSGAAVWPTGYVNFGPAEIQALGGTSLAPGGTLQVPQSLQGHLLSGGRSAIVTVAVQFVTDEDEVVTQTAHAELPEG